MIAHRIAPLLAGIFFVTAGTALAQTPAALIPLAQSELGQGYVLGPGDVIEVGVLGQPEFTTRQPIQADGTVTLQYLHSVRAAGQSVLQLRDQITRLLKQGGDDTDPVVVIGIVNYASRYVTVLGEFGSSGTLPVDRPYRVSEILARAGGVSQTAGDTLCCAEPTGRNSSCRSRKFPAAGPTRTHRSIPTISYTLRPRPISTSMGKSVRRACTSSKRL